MAWQLMPSSVYRMEKLRESTTRLRLLDDRDTVTLTMNTSSSRSSMPAEGSMSGTRHHTEKVIEPFLLAPARRGNGLLRACAPGPDSRLCTVYTQIAGKKLILILKSSPLGRGGRTHGRNSGEDHSAVPQCPQSGDSAEGRGGLCGTGRRNELKGRPSPPGDGRPGAGQQRAAQSEVKESPFSLDVLRRRSAMMKPPPTALLP